MAGYYLSEREVFDHLQMVRVELNNLATAPFGETFRISLESAVGFVKIAELAGECRTEHGPTLPISELIANLKRSQSHCEEA